MDKYGNPIKVWLEERLTIPVYVKGNQNAISELESIVANLEKAEELKQKSAMEREEVRRKALLEEIKLQKVK